MKDLFVKEREIVLENNHAKIVLDENAHFTQLICKKTGENLIGKAEPSCLCVVFSADGAERYPEKARYADGVVTADFGTFTVDISVDVREEFFIFELLSGIPEEYRGIRFANLRAGYRWDRNGFVITGFAMNINTNPNDYPDGKAAAVSATALCKFGVKGARYAVIAAEYGKLRDILKLACEATDPEKGIVSHAGGAYALDYRPNFGDYVIATDSDPEKIDGWIKFFSRYGVDQLDFHQCGRTVRQGDFHFHKTDGGEGFRKMISEPLNRAGIMTGLHTYVYYIDYDVSAILADPKWQKDLEVIASFTLDADINETDTVIPTAESTENISTFYGFFVNNSPLMMIDHEIISFVPEKRGFSGCVRGHSGTKAAPHKKGAFVKHLGGCFNRLAPVPGSELYLDMAHRTAKAYNEGGFGMIYLDALDGLNRHAPKDELWYYAALFVHEILKNCKTDPVIEYSAMYPSIWAARGRMNAWDTPYRSYKVWNDKHKKANLSYIDRFYTTTLGWYHFYPEDMRYPGNFSVKYKHFDDVDHLGSIAVAHDMSIVYNGLTEEAVESIPGLKRNMEHYQVYSRLRKSGYFPEEIKRKVRESGAEYAIRQKPDGSYAFYEKHYSGEKLQDARLDRCRGTNPFCAQKPFVRIENLLSSKGENAYEFAAFDENKPLREQNCHRTYPVVNMMDRIALRVRVFGNGSDDVICIRLSSATQSERGYSEYMIRLNYEGWREFILADIDNGDYLDREFEGMDRNGLYAEYRASVNYDRLTELKVHFSGECRDVRMGSIYFVKHLYHPVTDPTVTIGDKRITFKTTIADTDYLEYTPGDPAAFVYDRHGNCRTVEEIEGDLPEVQGEFVAALSGNTDPEMPFRAKLTFGFTGNEVK